MVVALKPHRMTRSGSSMGGRHDLSVGVRRGEGGYGDELFMHQVLASCTSRPAAASSPRKSPLFHSAYPTSSMDDGSTKEEWKMVVETKKILDPAIAVHATCVRVPVFIGHGEAVNVEFENSVTAGEARALLLPSGYRSCRCSRGWGYDPTRVPG